MLKAVQQAQLHGRWRAVAMSHLLGRGGSPTSHSRCPPAFFQNSCFSCLSISSRRLERCILRGGMHNAHC